MVMSSVPERGDVAEEYTWDLTDLYADDDEWEAAFESVEERLSELSAYEDRVTEDAETLQAVLELREAVNRRVENVAAYARMRRDEDTTAQTYQAFWARAQSLSADAASAASFIEPELQSVDRDRIDEFVEVNPDLAEYDHYFDDVLRMKPHTRSPAIEELLADLSEVTGAAGEVYTIFTNADIEFPAVEVDGEDRRITLSNFTTLQKHPDRDVRRRVYEAFYDEWDDYRNTIGTAYENSVTADTKLAEARQYETAREAALDGPNVPAAVYDTLVDTVEANLDVLHRHAELKRDCLGVDELRMWDLYAPLTGEETPDVEYDQATGYVVDAVAPLGEPYRDRMAAGLASRWVDVYETANKQSGAYSGGTYDSQPYILMNYQDDIASMFTLAHELGHSMHSELTSDSQPYAYASYEIFVAEIASMVNEALLTHHLLETLDDETLRRAVLDEYLERFRSTLFRQTMFASFEHRAHELSEAGEALTPDRLDELYHGLKSDYYAPAVVDDRIAREWMRIPHFYQAYYVYQYATGISAANAIADRILEEGESAAADYREFLRSGSRGYPLELLETAGIEMSSSTPIEAAIDTYDEMVGRYESLR
jgi:oligoendopeptidase F